ncbi:hypothetical protein DTL42_21250 [Bremerella cremea]|uniref:Uncharacterized protein n=1 Tax=Bremerella cremea TaxID=1031537 RepID=A0A368KK09_9BACT|nr:hypothetical protein [Bremerella cremea]RCS41108.1 hypothetical protein DTL42_21250 [Bremerella cremea]
MMLPYMVRATLSIALASPFTPVFLVLLGLAVVIRSHTPVTWHPREMVVLLPLLVTVALIVFGEVMALKHGIGPLWSWQQLTIRALLLSQIVMSGAILWGLKGLRISCLFLLLFEFCLSLAAGFEAAMSVSNRWL